MRAYAQQACAHVEGMTFSEFAQSDLHQYATFYALAVVGEAASHIGQDVQLANPNIPWRQIVSTRNRLIHAYYDIDVRIVWRTIKQDLPPLIARLEPMLPEQGA